MKTVNEIILKQQKTVLPAYNDEAYIDNIKMACAVNRNLASYGYSLDAVGLQTLRACSSEDIYKYYNEIMSAIKNYIGIENFNRTEPFYRNFPEEVMGKEEAELYFNAALYYYAQYNFGLGDKVREIITEEIKDRPPLLEEFERPLKILQTTNINEIAEEMRDKVHGIGISGEDLSDIKDFISSYPETKTTIIAPEEKFNSNENKVKIADMFYEEEKKETAKSLLSKTNDILRFYAVKGAQKKGITDLTNYYNLSFAYGPGKEHRANVNFFYALNGKDKKFIKECLADADDLYTAVWQNADIWQKAFTQYLKIDGHSDKRLIEVRDNLYSKRKIDEKGHEILTPNAQMEKAVEDFLRTEINVKEISALAEKAEVFSGLFVQNFNDIFHKILLTDASSEWRLGKIKEISDIYAGLRIAPVKTLALKNLINNEPDWDIKVAVTKTGRIQIYDNKNSLKNIKDALYEKTAKPGSLLYEVIEIINEGFEKSLDKSLGPNIGKIYIDEELEGIKMPQRNEREASDDTAMTRFSSIKGLEGKNLLAMGIYWKGDDVDIDAAVNAYDKDFKIVNNIAYHHLKTDWGVHSGDYVSAPNGAQEIILMDKEKMKENGIKYAVLQAFGYSGIFDECEEPVKFITMEKEGDLDFDTISKADDGKVAFNGEVVEAEQIDNVMTITGEGRQMIPAIYDVEEDSLIWIDKAQNIDGIANGLNVRSITMAEAMIRQAKQDATPTIAQLLESYGKHGKAEIVPMEEADTIFLRKPIDAEFKENAEIHTAAEKGYFSQLGQLGEEKDLEISR